MKKERRVYTKATDKLKKLFDNDSAVYFSNVGQDDETGVINSHGLSLEDADEVGQFEFLCLVGRHEALVGESVVGFKFDGDDYPNVGWATEMERYLGVSGVISEWNKYNDSFEVVFDGYVNYCFPAELVAKQLDEKSEAEKGMRSMSLSADDLKRKPSHYAKGIDTFARMEANCTKEECLAFAKGNIDKYNWRTKGQDLEDFDKIIAYAEWAKKMLK